MKDNYRYQLIVTRQLNDGKLETKITKSRNLLTLNRLYKNIQLNENDNVLQMAIYDYVCMKYVKYYETPYVVKVGE